MVPLPDAVRTGCISAFGRSARAWRRRGRPGAGAELGSRAARTAERAASEYAAGVGHEFDRLQLGLLFEEKGEQHQTVAQVPGTTMPFRPLNWLDSRLYQVTPRTGRYFGFGPAWMALDGAVKRMPVRRGDIAGTPDF